VNSLSMLASFGSCYLSGQTDWLDDWFFWSSFLGGVQWSLEPGALRL
jgi:hypothetical protein